jgi:Ca-activated chloride channel family protein
MSKDDSAAAGPAKKQPSAQAWLRLPRIRRGLAAGLVVLSTGGLVLARTPVQGGSTAPELHVATAGGSNAASFSGPRVHGRFALSHTAVLAGGERRIFAELDLRADVSEHAAERAPLAIAVVLDTSGSMGGEKIDEAKRACERLVEDMRDDDEIAFVRYASGTELVQPLARVGLVRRALVARIRALQANGGTNIPPALQQAMTALSDAGKGRVRRVVLASDGLDGSRALAEQYATQSAARGVTVSSMGIGLDFDEGYMGGLARAGHGNFGFVKDGASLATFLRRELEETAGTTVEGITARVHLPEGVRFVQATGADGKQLGGGELELAVGSLFGGDERRIMVELEASVAAGQLRSFEGSVAWSAVGGDTATARFAGVTLAGSSDALAVDAGRDGAVLANAASVLASAREIEAAAAYAQGDTTRARALIDQNVVELAAAASAAPAAAAPALAAQAHAYEGDRRAFAAPPSSDMGRAAAKAAAAKNAGNASRALAY